MSGANLIAILLLACVAAGLSLEEVQELFNAKHGSAPGLQAGETDLRVVAA